MSLPNLSLPKKLFFSGLFFILILLAAEFLLSLAGLEKYDQLFMPKSSYPIFVPGKGEMAEYYVTSSHFAGYLNTQHFLRDKPDRLTRIFVVGGSAAYGWPYTDEYCFSGYLRRALDRAAPGRFEIVNAAGMSFGSHRVLDILRDVVELEPDLVIVFSGNNEYIERNILPESSSGEGARAQRLAPVLRQLEIYRAVRLALFRAYPSAFQSGTKQDITDIRANPEVERGALGRSTEVDREVLRNFQNNMAAMRNLLATSGIRAIFCTVPVDVGGWIPQVGDPQFKNQAQASRWVELHRLKDEAFRRQDLEQELAYLREMLAITPDDPGVLFNYGKTLWNLGRYQESWQALNRAKDLDVSPRRALSSFNEFIRFVASGNSIYLADLERAVEGRFLEGIAENLFLDYCHFTESGNKFIAETLLSSLRQALNRGLPGSSDLKKMIEADSSFKGMPPLLQGQVVYARALTLQNNGRMAEAEDMYRQLLEISPDFSSALSNLGNIYSDRGEVTEASKLYQQAIAANPKNTNALVSLASLFLYQNRDREAEELYLKSLAINPYLPAATVGLGNLAMQTRDHAKAIDFYEKTLALGREDAAMRRNLGDAYFAVNDRKNALKNWHAALALNPHDQDTRALVEKYAQGP
ncbi:MAG: tetratricopeptide repeat protein [Thermodesulfobacteriota bacterium]